MTFSILLDVKIKIYDKKEDIKLEEICKGLENYFSLIQLHQSASGIPS